MSLNDGRYYGFVKTKAFSFKCNFSDGLSSVFNVMHKDGFTEAEALEKVKLYGTAIGRIPTYMRKDVLTVSIMKGDKPFGGGNKNLLIHTTKGDTYIKDGILEETFMHEASHTSLDSRLATSSEWVAAQKADNGNFFTVYAKLYPTREDVAETYLLWWALRKSTTKSSKVFTATEIKNLEELIPNRLAVFDKLDKERAWFKDESGAGWTSAVIV